MKKVLILLITLLLIATTFVTIANAKIDKQRIFSTKKHDGPILDFLKKIPFINKTINFFKNLFGLAEDIEDIEPPEEFEKDYKTYYQDVDPRSETPTDNSISVSIKNFDITYSDNKDNVEFELTFDGSTSGDVYACYYIIVTYYEDGTNSYAQAWLPPFKQPKISFDDYSTELTFIGTGPEGDDDWSSFEGKYYFSGDINPDDIPIETQEEKQGKTPKDVRLFVRAFSDTELTKWNQDSMSMMGDMTGLVYEENEKNEEQDGSGIPGFELLFVIIALSILLILMRRKKL